jgi:phosphonate transport system ATP-binding protein
MVAPVSALAVSGLAKAFGEGNRRVFEDITFTVPKGQSVALIGPNGAGKSTLLRCCLRLEEPDAGTIHLSGAGLTGARGRALRAARSRVGFVFQRHNLVPRLSVLSNVMHGGLARGHGIRAWSQALASPAERARALECLERVGLADLARRRADHLSGGQSQRVAVARALMQGPEMLFADEPCASLDPQAGEEVMGVFRTLNQQAGLTLVFVSHQLDHALTYADRVIGLRDRGIALDATTASQSIPALRDLYE